MRIIGIVLLVLCGGSFSSTWAWDGYVVKVIDGDSLRVKKGLKIIEIRLYGIDSPEWGQDYGNKAKKVLKIKLYRKRVSVVSKDIDRYGRTVALVSSSSGLVNREMVREGYAWMYPKYCKQQPLCAELKKLQQTARARRLGLWRGQSPVSPWRWKWQQRKKNH